MNRNKVDIVDWASTKDNFRAIIESCREKIQTGHHTFSPLAGEDARKGR